MYTARRLSSEKEFLDMADIAANAYPGLKFDTPEDKEKVAKASMKTQNENPFVDFYGVFNEEEMLGSMRLHDFNLNLLSEKIKAGGLGFVAVHQLHKKEKVAKEIVTYFIEHYKKQGAAMVMLYPFRPDFYKKMGFGFGTSMNQYKVKPCNLPKGPSKSKIKFLNAEDAEKMLNCYSRVYEKTNGLIEKYESEFNSILNNPKAKVAAYKLDDKVEGYIVYEYKTREEKSVLVNDIIVNDLVYENKKALSELMTFLNSQNDQIRYVIFNIQDEDFRFLLDDPRNDSDNMFAPVYHECSIQGTGLMYRVVNTRELFCQLKEHNFNNESCRLKVMVKDSFIKENEGSVIVNFENGYPTLSDTEDFDVEIVLDVADFSSLIACAVNFKSLYKYGRVCISNEEYINKVNNMFNSDVKPICLTRF